MPAVPARGLANRKDQCVRHGAGKIGWAIPSRVKL